MTETWDVESLKAARADEITYGYVGDISKYDETPDGLIVHGIASSPALDLDAQIADPTWLKSALPEWQQWGNVRAMHTSVAAGVGKELVHGQGDKWELKSLIVDDDTIKKIRTGVYKGYSVGIKGARTVKDAAAPGGRIVGGKIVEISVVDRPCNPDSVMSIAKAHGAALAPVDVAGAVIAKFDDIEATPEPSTTVDNPVDNSVAKSVILTPREYRAAMAALDELETLNKAPNDEAADIANAQRAIAIVARLIQSEAAELAAGRDEEAIDIEILSRAVECLQRFKRREQMQDGQDPSADDATVSEDVSYVGLSAQPEVAKTAAEPKPKKPKKDKSVTKSVRIDSAEPNDQTVDVSEYVTKAVAEVRKPLEAELNALRGELTKVLARPIPGSPMITNAMPSIAQATPVTADVRKSAAYWQAQADRSSDPAVKRAFEAKAREVATTSN